MECDIHTVTEVFNGSSWEVASLTPPVFDYRSYGLYGFLADVRNYSAIPSLYKGLGWPDNISHEAYALKEYWNDNSFGHTYVLLSELIEFDYDRVVEDRRVTRQIAPNCWDGRCTAEPGGGTMTTYREFLGEEFFSDVEKLKALAEPQKVRVLMLFES